MEILLVEDEEDFRVTCAQWFEKKGHRVVQAADGHEALRICDRRQFDVAILDQNIPGPSGLEVLSFIQANHKDTESILLTANASVQDAVSAMKLGAFDYLTKPFPLAELEQRCLLAWEHASIRRENKQLKQLLRRSHKSPSMLGASPQIGMVRRMIEKAAPTDMSVLIQGESGTGKELVARAIHEGSSRVDKPFVVVNCGALPENLAESEFFGHERGAFTGADASKPGLFEAAHRGTLFIDEIGEMALHLQPKLLRVLEDGVVRRVGSLKERRVDVRIVSATNRDLAYEAQERRFRPDLLYRLKVISIDLPPLRERKGDTELLVKSFLGSAWEIEDEALGLLRAYRWPGNVRQLIHAIEHAKVLAEDDLITVDDLPAEVIADDHDSHNLVRQPIADDHNLASIERSHVIDALRDAGWNKTRAARILGIHRRKLYRLIERHTIDAEAAEGPSSVDHL